MLFNKDSHLATPQSPGDRANMSVLEEARGNHTASLKANLRHENGTYTGCTSDSSHPLFSSLTQPPLQFIFPPFVLLVIKGGRYEDHLCCCLCVCLHGLPGISGRTVITA